MLGISSRCAVHDRRSVRREIYVFECSWPTMRSRLSMQQKTRFWNCTRLRKTGYVWLTKFSKIRMWSQPLEYKVFSVMHSMHIATLSRTLFCSKRCCRTATLSAGRPQAVRSCVFAFNLCVDYVYMSCLPYLAVPSYQLQILGLSRSITTISQNLYAPRTTLI